MLREGSSHLPFLIISRCFSLFVLMLYSHERMRGKGLGAQRPPVKFCRNIPQKKMQ